MGNDSTVSHALGPDERLAAVLRHIHTIEVSLQSLQHDLVKLVNELGISWDRIGEAHSVLYLKQHRGLPFVMVNRQTWVVPWTALDEWLTDQAWGQGRSVPLDSEPAPGAEPEPSPVVTVAEPAPLVVSVPEAADLLRVSKRTIFQLISEGTLKSLTLGRRRLIPYREIERLGHAANENGHSPRLT